MENKGVYRIIVAKPVASRPSSSMIRHPPDLLIGVNRELVLDVGPKTGAGPIKPKTVRFKPPLTHGLPPSILPQGDGPETDIQPSLLYRPLAKAVSKATVSVLAKMGNFEHSHRQTKPSVGALIDAIEHQPEKPLSLRSQLGSKSCGNLRDMPTTASGNCSTSLPLEDSRDMPPVVGVDRPSYDGYKWRKYGQKQVKGSEYPRSYYKCTHPNCPVKKKVERSLDGQIAEIVYKGEHSHPKPQPPKRGLGAGQDVSNSMTGNRGVEKKDVSEDGAAGTNDINMKVALARDPAADVDITACELNPDASGGLSAEYEIDPDDRSKRRKIRNQLSEVEINGESPQEPQISVQDSVDPIFLGDGFRWRKYGQKIVKGNSHPRSYYKCTSVECNVRKHVERALDDPNTFITTYEGKHNHEMPRRTTTMPSSESNPRATSSKEKKPT